MFVVVYCFELFISNNKVLAIGSVFSVHKTVRIPKAAIHVG